MAHVGPALLHLSFSLSYHHPFAVTAPNGNRSDCPPKMASDLASLSTAPDPGAQDAVTSSAFTLRGISNQPFLKRSMALPLLLFPDGDTLVYIDPVPVNHTKHPLKPTIPLRIHSEKLLATGSAYFQHRFTPRVQNRVRKQRGFADKLPDGIKHVLDLTPPILEDDAIITMTEVSCPRGIRTWASTKNKWELPGQCVGGDDECEIVDGIFSPVVISGPPIDHIEDEGHSNDVSGALENEEGEGRQDSQEVEPSIQVHKRLGLPVEYSAKRHREGIEMTLNVLEGLNITLDTPCKLWTFFAVAKLFDVATVPAVGDLISSWFYMSRNTRFIEIHPEITYRVACGIKSYSLCRYAFVVLVGDEALLYLIRCGGLTPMKPWKDSFTQSRISDYLDDTEVQRIEYASKSFADDLVGYFLHLAGTDMPWLEETGEVQKLVRHFEDYPVDRYMVLALKKLLRDYVRYMIYVVLCEVADPWRSFDAIPKRDSDQNFHLFGARDLVQRIIGKRFWNELLSFELDSPPFLPVQTHSSIADVGSGLLAFEGQENAQIDRINLNWLAQKVMEFNSTLSRARWPINALAMKAQSVTSENQLKDLTINMRHFVSLTGGPAPLPNRGISTSIEAHQTLPFRPAPSKNATPASSVANQISNLTQESSLHNPVTLDNVEDREFDLGMFFAQVRSYVGSYARKLLYHDEARATFFDVTETLTCLGDNQYRFLPLWAGGNDDGTGGVFSDQDIPDMETGGFSAPGPAVHTGSVASTDDSFSEINPDDSRSTVHGASHHATYSHVSDLMSVDSADIAPVESSEDALNGQFSEVMHIVQESSVAEDWLDLDNQSDGDSTVVMGSPSLSDGFDMEASDSEDNLDDAEAEPVDGDN